MTTFNRSLTNYKQERISKEDIRLLIEAVETSERLITLASRTRVELLIGKLKRMLK